MTIRFPSPRVLLLIAWLGLVLYAFPGYMSYDSVFQLYEARTWSFTEQHPPVMALMWRFVDCFIAGPLGMLVIQSLCFLAGAYLLFRRWMSARAAAICAGVVLWFPVCASTMAVIWKDSQMAAFLLLGAALVGAERRRTRLFGLACLWLATAMRHNALAMTFPLIVFLFYWDPSHRAWKRYAIALVTWLAVTLSVQVTTKLLVTENNHLWHRGMALYDIVGTLRYMEPMTDDELRTLLAGAPLQASSELHAMTREPVAEWNYAMSMVVITERLFDMGTARHRAEMGKEQRDAVARAWSTIVLGHPIAYLTHRWHIFVQLLQLREVPDELQGSAVYYWFVDIQEMAESAKSAEHDASPGGIQRILQRVVVWAGTTRLFRIYVYAFLSLLLLPLCVRDRALFAIVASGLTGEAALFILAPVTDLRYSFWLVVTTLVVICALIAKRTSASFRRRPAIASGS